MITRAQELLLHVPGGAEDAGSPVCPVAGELRIGAHDVHLGTVHGVEVHEQRSQPDSHFRSGWTVELDLVPGIPPGFGLWPGERMRFALRDSR